MARSKTKIVKPLKVISPAKKRDMTHRAKDADKRVERRYEWAQFARAHQGTLKQCRAAMIEAMEAGELALPLLNDGQTIADAAPSVYSIHTWRHLEASKVNMTALRDKPRPGRPKVRLAPALDEMLLEFVSSGLTTTVVAFHKKLGALAEQLGIDPPSYTVVYRCTADYPHVFRVTARHGKKAGLASGVVHSAVPAPYPHYVWSEDEFDPRVWVKMASRKSAGLVAVKPEVNFVIEGHTGLILNFFAAHPLTRNALRGSDRFDIRAGLVGAAFKDFAQPACVPYAGHLGHGLRFDRAKSHEQVREIAKSIGMHVAELPGNTPWPRGQAEKTVELLKEKLKECWGHEDSYEVAEYASETKAQIDAKGADANTRTTRKQPIMIQHLHNLDQFVVDLNAAVKYVNEELEHRAFGVSRASKYWEQLQPELARPGTDAIALLDPMTVTVQPAGIVVSGLAFLPVDPSVRLNMGDTFAARMDPAMRGMYLVDRTTHELILCRPKAEVAAGVDAAEYARAMRDEVAYADQIAEQLQKHRRNLVIGALGGALADDVAKQRLNLEPQLMALHQGQRAADTAETSRAKREAAQFAPKRKSKAARRRAPKAPTPVLGPTILPTGAPPPMPAGLNLGTGHRPGVIPIQSPLRLVPGANGHHAPMPRRGIRTSW